MAQKVNALLYTFFPRNSSHSTTLRATAALQLPPTRESPSILLTPLKIPGDSYAAHGVAAQNSPGETDAPRKHWGKGWELPDS